MAGASLVAVEHSVEPSTPPVERDLLTPAPGQVTGLIGPPGLGLTRLGLKMLASQSGLLAYLDVRGWLSPPAAWETGINPDRLVVVRCGDPVRWGRVASALLDGVAALYAEVPSGIRDAHLRKLGALARSTRTPLVLRPVRRDLPEGITQLRLDAREVVWEGADAGHGRLERRRLVIEASGKVMRGMQRRIEVEDDGTHAVRLVSGLAVAPSRRVVG